jgi:putative solute:sodium symporter small subunit
MIDKAKLEAYWRENQKLTAITLIIWFLVSFGAILIVTALNNITIFGFPLGYYMGAQGSLIVFVLLIANYARKMNQIDKKYGVEEE